MQYQVTFNKNNDVYQHNYESQLELDDFTDLLSQEWMIDYPDGDDITVEILETA